MTAGTEESLADVVARYAANSSLNPADALDHARSALRWSGSALTHPFGPNGDQEELAAAVAGVAVQAGDFASWELVYDQFLQCFPRAARRVGAEILGQGITQHDFIVVCADQEEDLLPLSLTPEQLALHFPELVDRG
ncbi:MAG: hypothetical protein KBB39_05330 [Phycicoccus sp.]|nr:hypothetical protein [Phycicoccus sp.]